MEAAGAEQGALWETGPTLRGGEGMPGRAWQGAAALQVGVAAWFQELFPAPSGDSVLGSGGSPALPLTQAGRLLPCRAGGCRQVSVSLSPGFQAFLCCPDPPRTGAGGGNPGVPLQLTPQNMPTAPSRGTPHRPSPPLCPSSGRVPHGTNHSWH